MKCAYSSEGHVPKCMTIRFTHLWLKFRALELRQGTQCSKPVTHHAHVSPLPSSVSGHTPEIYRRKWPQNSGCQTLFFLIALRREQGKGKRLALYSSVQIGRKRKLSVLWRPADAVRDCLLTGFSLLRGCY